SVDLWRGAADSRATWVTRIGLRALQVHLCLVYLNAGFAKLQGEQWRSGEALWRAVLSPQFAQFELSRLAEWPLVLRAGCWLTMLVECGYAFAVWVPKLRRPWLMATIGLHVGIGLFMGLWLFSALMIVLNVACFQVSSDAARHELDGEGEASSSTIR
ncbi:MAG: hypothetical protein ACO1OB_14415, partial [Archangium sp.]